MTKFALPKSYCAYCKDRAVQSAVDHILDAQELDVPADLEWCRLPDFHAAVLGAHQVRCDFATALHGLWTKVWQHALDDCGFADSLEPLSLDEQRERSDYPHDTYSVWESGTLERVYNAGDHKFGLGVGVAETMRAWLTIWLLDGRENDRTANLDLGDDWDPTLDDEGYRWTHDELARFSNDGCGIPLDPLNRAARRALEQIPGHLGGAE